MAQKRKLPPDFESDSEPSTSRQAQRRDPSATQNPISALYELGTRLAIKPEFTCNSVGGLTPKFEGYCKFGDQTFGPAYGKNNKEAKLAVFTLAFEAVSADPSTQLRLNQQRYEINGDFDSISVPSDAPVSLSHEEVQNVLSQKNPISSFMEYGQARRMVPEIVEVDTDGPDHCRKFTFRCKLDDQYYPEATARTKKEARKHAAVLALRCLSSGSISSNSQTKNRPNNASTSAAASLSPQMPLTDSSTSDQIAYHVLSQFNSLKGQCTADLGKIILAGFTIQDTKANKFTVVSIGTGSKCISGQNISSDGSRVNDCHAEVIARRGLLRYFYQQLAAYKTDTKSTIFKSSSDGKKVKLRKRLRLHLYISTAPCGDGAVFSHNDTAGDLTNYSLDNAHLPTMEVKVHGQLRTKMEDGEGTIPTKSTSNPVLTMDGIRHGERLVTMSCSDKICKWNILGVQGTLLSGLMEPVYIHSLVVGQLFNPGHLSRALCCRVNSFQSSLTQMNSVFKVNHLKIDRTATELPRSIAKSKPLSLNWAKGDEHCEILNGETGQVILSQNNSEHNPVSRVSRRSLYGQYTQLVLPDEDHCYGDAKALVTDYVLVKEALYREFANQDLGCWVQKPPEQNMFK